MGGSAGGVTWPSHWCSDLHSGKQEHVHDKDMQPEMNMFMSIHIANYSWSTPVILRRRLEDVHTRRHSHVHHHMHDTDADEHASDSMGWVTTKEKPQRFLLQSQNGHRLHIEVEVQLDEYGTCHVAVYAAYWVMNRTSLHAQLRQDRVDEGEDAPLSVDSVPLMNVQDMLLSNINLSEGKQRKGNMSAHDARIYTQASIANGTSANVPMMGDATYPMFFARDYLAGGGGRSDVHRNGHSEGSQARGRNSVQSKGDSAISGSQKTPRERGPVGLELLAELIDMTEDKQLDQEALEAQVAAAEAEGVFDTNGHVSQTLQMLSLDNNDDGKYSRQASMQLRLRGTTWSPPFAVTGSSSMDTGAVPMLVTDSQGFSGARRKIVVEVGVAVRVARGKFHRTKTITVTPRHIIVNRTPHALDLRQEGATSIISVSAEPGNNQVVFHWSDPTKNRRNVRLALNSTGGKTQDLWHERWSTAIPITQEGDHVIMMDTNPGSGEYFFADVRVRRFMGSVVAIVQPSATDRPPYMIENFSSSTLRVYQFGVSKYFKLIRPYQCVPYAWESVLESENKLVVEVEGSSPLISGQYQLDEVGAHRPMGSSNGNAALFHVSVRCHGPTLTLTARDALLHPVEFDSSVSMSSGSSPGGVYYSAASSVAGASRMMGDAARSGTTMITPRNAGTGVFTRFNSDVAESASAPGSGPVSWGAPAANVAASPMARRNLSGPPAAVQGSNAAAAVARSGALTPPVSRQHIPAVLQPVSSSPALMASAGSPPPSLTSFLPSSTGEINQVSATGDSQDTHAAANNFVNSWHKQQRRRKWLFQADLQLHGVGISLVDSDCPRELMYIWLGVDAQTLASGESLGSTSLSSHDLSSHNPSFSTRRDHIRTTTSALFGGINALSTFNNKFSLSLNNHPLFSNSASRASLFAPSLANANSKRAACGLSVCLWRTHEEDGLSISLCRLQIDNMLSGATYPVVVSLAPPKPVFLLGGSTDDIDTQNNNLINITVIGELLSPRIPHFFRLIDINIRPLDVALEEALVLSLLQFGYSVAQRLSHVSRRIKGGLSEGDNNGLNVNASGSGAANADRSNQASNIPEGRAGGLEDKELAAVVAGSGLLGNTLAIGKIYLHQLHIHPVSITLSYTPAVTALGVDSLMSLQHLVVSSRFFLQKVDDLPLYLSALHLHHSFGTGSALLARICNHYLQQYLVVASRVVGSTGLIGNPLGLVTSISTGVADLFKQPVREIERGFFRRDGKYTFLHVSVDVMRGLLRGGRSLFRHSVLGWCDTICKSSSSGARFFAFLSMDQEFAAYISREWHDRDDSQRVGLVPGILVGLGGLARLPALGWRQGWESPWRAPWSLLAMRKNESTANFLDMVTQPASAGSCSPNHQGDGTRTEVAPSNLQRLGAALPGLVNGIIKAIAGLAAKPIAGSLDVAAMTAAQMMAAVQGSTGGLGVRWRRMRPPRVFGHDRVLRALVYKESQASHLLARIEGGRFAAFGAIDFFDLYGSGALIVTPMYLVCLPPEGRNSRRALWSVDVRDVLCCEILAESERASVYNDEESFECAANSEVPPALYDADHGTLLAITCLASRWDGNLSSTRDSTCFGALLAADDTCGVSNHDNDKGDVASGASISAPSGAGLLRTYYVLCLTEGTAMRLKRTLVSLFDQIQEQVHVGHRAAGQRAPGLPGN
jgi:hypothetical protein